MTLKTFVGISKPFSRDIQPSFDQLQASNHFPIASPSILLKTTFCTIQRHSTPIYAVLIIHPAIYANSNGI